MEMFPQITEWMDAYERDISVLGSARNALLSHPLRRTVPELIDASLCRSLAVIMIANIDHLLESWKEGDPRGILRQYFNSGAKNDAKVTSLLEAFRNAGMDVDRAVFDDYLAIKYLRNAIVHARWKDYEKDWVSERGFPLDMQKLTKEHWERMLRVHESMSVYLMAVFLPGWEKAAKKPLELVPDRPPVLLRKDIVRIFWSNLEAIDHSLYLEFKNATDQGRIRGAWESKEEWWNALWNESRANPDLFAPQRQLVEAALFSWDEYCRFTFDRENLTISELERTRDTLRELRAAVNSPLGYLAWPTKRDLDSAALAERTKLLKAQLRPDAQINIDAAERALDIGEDVSRIMINITPCSLFATRLPIVDPQGIAAFRTRATYALLAMEVSLLWKHLVDGGEPDLSVVDFSRTMLATMERQLHT